VPAAPRAERASPGRQRGAVGLFGILTLLLALVFTALAVDAGRLWFERREIQAVADLAALEAARQVGCGGNPGNAVAAAQAAAKRNGFAGNLADAPNRVDVGWLTTAAGLRQFSASRPAANFADADAVHVLATESVPASLVLGGFFGQTTLIWAEATARAEPPHATFSLGSYLLRVSATPQDANLLNALLGGLLPSSLSLDALAYKGLASTDINLAQLVRAQGLGVGTVEQLLDTQLSVAQVINLAAAAVGQQVAVDTSVTAGLQTLLGAAVNNIPVKLGDVLDVSVPASDAAAKVGINVFDLITTTLMVANKNSAVALPLGIPGVANVNLAIIQPPQLAVGPPGTSSTGDLCTEARTAQLDLEVALNPLGLGLVDAVLGLELAQGSASLDRLDLAPGVANARINAVPGIAALNLTNGAHTGPATVGGGLLGIGLNLPIADPHAAPLDYSVPYPPADHLPMTKSTSASVGSSLQSALSDPHALEIEVLGLPLLGNLLKPLVAPIVAPLLGAIGSAVLDPLLKLLGIQLGGLDVTIEDIRYSGGAQLVI
jgi:uncharacterized membrane protein